jgi:hypothetical protein
MPAQIIRFCSAVIAACGLIALQFDDIALAETQQDIPFDYPGAGFSYAVAGIGQGMADIDGGGSYSTSSLLLRLGLMKLMSRGTLIGFGVSLGNTRYNFEDLAAFGGQAPWNTVRNINFSIPVITRIDRNWAFLFAPSVGVFKETGASTSDSLAYGAVMAASYRFEDKSRIGVGLGVFNRLDETKLFPFLSINLRLTDNLRLGNPLRAGPTGPAGLELAYKIDQTWEVAIGRAFRSYRFRLNEEGLAPGGIGTQSGQLTFLRVSNQLQKKLRLDIHLGVVLDGSLRIQNNVDDDGIAVDYDTAPLLGVNLNGRF